METPQKVRRAFLIVLALTADVGLIVIWATRPPLIYSKWLAMERADESPVRYFRQWTGGVEAPLTPFGLISFFEPLDLVIVGALLFVFAILVVLLAMTCLGGSSRLLAGLRRRLYSPPSLRQGVRATMLAVAVVALGLSWEVNGWETWRLRQGHLRKFYEFADRADEYRKQARALRADIEQAGVSSGAGVADFRNPEATEHDSAAFLDRQRREMAYSETMADICAGLVQKYEYALAHPRDPIEPDPPLPARTPDAFEWLAQSEFRRALDDLDE